MRVMCGGGRLEEVGRAGVRPKLEWPNGAGLCCYCRDPASVLEVEGVEDFEQALIGLL